MLQKNVSKLVLSLYFDCLGLSRRIHYYVVRQRMICVHLAYPHACRSIFLEPQVVFTEDLSTQLSEVRHFLLSWWFSLSPLWDCLISLG